MSTVREETFLAEWLPRLPRNADLVIPPGDDCAGIRQAGDSLLLIAADQVTAGHHYSATDDPRLVGRKLLARNLSDVAAMGGTPTYAVVTLALPRETTAVRADALMAGIVELASEHGVIIAGGDLGAAASEVATLTIMGTVSADEVVCRSSAKTGDHLFVTGQLGGSLPSGRHLDFSPRLAEGRWLAAQGFATAMIDVSDGLVVDLDRLCRASAVSATLELSQVPRHPEADVTAACYDGEDYELLFSCSAARAAELRRAWPFATALTPIGTCLPAAAAPGQALPLHGAFAHFASNSNSSLPLSRVFGELSAR